jgi:hypothetical protein
MAGRQALGPQLAAERLRSQALEDELVAARRELVEYKLKVAEKAVEVQQENNLCLLGLNTVLRDLGLPEIPDHFKVTARVRAVQTVEYEFDLDNLPDDYERTEEGVRTYLAEYPDSVTDNASDFSWEMDEESVEIVSAVGGTW